MKMLKRILSILLVLSIAGTMLLLPVQAEELPFSDIEGHWAEEYIIRSYELKLFQGFDDGTFRPDAHLTRAELIQVLYNHAGQPAVEGESSFTDGNGEWYTPAVIWAEQIGIMNGYPDGSCGALDPLPRQQMVTFLFRYFEGTAPEDGDLSVYPDLEDVEPWALDAFSWAVSEGIVNGMPNEEGVLILNPKAYADRASFAKLMVCLLDPSFKPSQPEDPTVPEETEPVETEPVETEPVETEPQETEPVETEPQETTEPEEPVIPSEETSIVFSDETILVNGDAISADPEEAVYAANDIIFYLEGQGTEYGEGTTADEHSQAEADAHTVVHITNPGTYRLSGTLSAGQVAIDLGEDAKTDPNARVTLILDNVDIECTVAPAVIFYSVYECCSAEESTSTPDTSAAGANVILAEDSVNTITGSYVAKIYKPGTTSKLHKYDAAFYSRQTMNVQGESNGTGILNIKAENEGLDSELHLTIHRGILNITAGNDCINTNEDFISVTTINGGTLTAISTGSTGEGDSIDSNGWLVINGGRIIAQGHTNDGSVDADNGVILNGGTLIATGGMQPQGGLSGSQSYVTFNASVSAGEKQLTIRDSNGTILDSFTSVNGVSYLIYSAPDMPTSCSLYNGSSQLAGSGSGSTTPERPSRP